MIRAQSSCTPLALSTLSTSLPPPSPAFRGHRVEAREVSSACARMHACRGYNKDRSSWFKQLSVHETLPSSITHSLVRPLCLSARAATHAQSTLFPGFVEMYTPEFLASQLPDPPPDVAAMLQPYIANLAVPVSLQASAHARMCVGACMDLCCRGSLIESANHALL